MIDLGPLVIDLWRYLKTDLFRNWKERSVAPDNYKDIYFAYHSNSKFRPQPKHFKFLKPEITTVKIAVNFQNIIVKLEKKKGLNTTEKSIQA
jgi:hypothetical protein